MATETDNYPNEQAMKAAKTRGGVRHTQGWRPLHTNLNQDGTWSIVWNNDPPPPPPPNRQLTESQFIAELAEERGVDII